MTPTQIKLLIAGAVALAGWLFGDKRPPSGSVDLGVGTVDGVYGGDYTTPAPAADPNNPAVDPTMHALVNQSNQAIAAFDAAHPETGAIL